MALLRWKWPDGDFTPGVVKRGRGVICGGGASIQGACTLWAMDGAVMLGRTMGPSITVLGLWVQYVAGPEATAPAILSLVLVVLRAIALCLGQVDVGHCVLVVAYSLCVAMPPTAGSWAALAGLCISIITEFVSVRRTPLQPL